uniref:Uncharacterized protein n=2 Tax=Cucumis melo TaxID=3656 RepID=A0A9I9EEN5_CUCME
MFMLVCTQKLQKRRKLKKMMKWLVTQTMKMMTLEMRGILF